MAIKKAARLTATIDPRTGQMDSFYDKEAAGTTLENFARRSREALAARNLRSTVHMADLKLLEVDVKETKAGRRNWRFCVTEEDDDEPDELVVRLQGILTKNNLVPKNVQACAPGKAQFLSQHLEVTGAGTATFREAMSKVQVVFDRFANQLAGMELAPIADGQGDGSDTFVASNRIFSLKSDLPTEQDNCFEDGVDSAGFLQRLKRNEYIHAPENIVKYLRKRSGGRAGLAYVHFYPGGFQVGDLVEIQVSFVAVSARSKVKVTTRLHAVTLLDSKYAAEAAIARANAAFTNLSNPTFRKRVGYFEQDEEDERKMKKQRSQSPAAMTDGV
ncbi:hypothetical protein C8R46DRAFT_1218224 [Mycena filopes]|nr:hypothetical protein C8R46DRAFT_1228140 [Mycena filopes]KAJ7168839.1 hypothetical protein C8R46DRAFT_1218224 [Mycena filopes]